MPSGLFVHPTSCISGSIRTMSIPPPTTPFVNIYWFLSSSITITGSLMLMTTRSCRVRHPFIMVLLYRFPSRIRHTCTYTPDDCHACVRGGAVSSTHVAPSSSRSRSHLRYLLDSESLVGSAARSIVGVYTYIHPWSLSPFRSLL